MGKSYFYWSKYPEVEKCLKSLYSEYGNNWQGISDIMNDKFGEKYGTEFTYNSVRQKIMRSEIIEYQPEKRGYGIFKDLPGELEANYFNWPQVKGHIEDLMEYFEEKYGNKEIKVLDCSDLHTPYTDYDALEYAVIENQDADILILKGDIVSYEAYSRYGNRRSISIIDEHKRLYQILEPLSDIFDQIIIFEGNHERRARHNIQKKVVRGLNGVIDNELPLSDVLSYFDNIIYIPHFFIKLGDMVFAHPDHFSSIPARTAANEFDNMLGNQVQLEFGKISALSIGHTHKLIKIWYKGVLLFETGCLCHPIDYKKEKNTKEGWQKGFATHIFKNGKISLNDSKIIAL
ncbi:MAG: metallophosphoesterase [archaeon]